MQKKSREINEEFALLQRLAHSAAGAFSRDIPAMLERLQGALLAHADSTIRPEESRICMYRYTTIHKNADALADMLRRELTDVIHGEIVKKFTPTVNQEFSLDDTELVSMSEMEMTVILGNLARAAENNLGDILSSLNLRLSVLFKNKDFSIADNPFRPEVFFRAMANAWQSFDEHADESTLIVLRLLTPHVYINLNPIYQLLNDCLIGEGILPQHIDTYRRERTQAFEVTQIRVDQLNNNLPPGGVNAPATDMAAQQSLLGRLQRLLTGQAANHPMAMPTIMPSLNQASQLLNTMSFMINPPPAPLMVDSGMIQFLTNLQQRFRAAAQTTGQSAGNSSPDAGHPLQPTLSQPNVLHELRKNNNQHTFSEMDAPMVNLLAHVFDFIFRDRQLPPEIKFLIGQLQIPVLKAALLDRNFFFQESHPARRLINLLGKAGVGWIRANGMDDPLYVLISDITQKIQNEFTDDLGLFEQCIGQLETFLEEEEEEIEIIIEPNVSEQLLAENQKLAYEAAHREIQSRKASGEVSSMLDDFLDDMWLPVLAHAYMHQADDPMGWPDSLKVMDDLIWSVQPKTSVDERNKLLDLLPVLVKRLNEQLDTISIDFPARTKFMAALVERHAAVVRYAFKLSATHQLKHAELMARRAVTHRLQSKKDEQPPIIRDAYDALVDSMARGVWLEYQRETPQGMLTLNFRLTWISPMRSRFLMTNRQGYDALVKTPLELASDLRNGLATVLNGQPILSRAIESAVEELETSQAA